MLNAMRQAVEPVYCLLSPLDWANQLKDHIAIAVQRGNADIMVTAAMRDRQYERHGRPRSRPVHARAVTYTAAAAPAAAGIDSLSSPSDSSADCERDDDVPMTAVGASLAELSLMAADDAVVNAATAAQDVHSVCAVCCECCCARRSGGAD